MDTLKTETLKTENLKTETLKTETLKTEMGLEKEKSLIFFCLKKKCLFIDLVLLYFQIINGLEVSTLVVNGKCFKCRRKVEIHCIYSVILSIPEDRGLCAVLVPEDQHDWVTCCCVEEAGQPCCGPPCCVHRSSPCCGHST